MSKKYRKAQAKRREDVKKPEVLENQLAFSKQNYILTAATFGILIIGFILMSADSETFGFGFLGITLGPLVLLGGFVFAIFAILFNQKR